MNTQIIACSNQKGGTAKTTCVNLGIGLARAGKKVLLVDCDPQASLTRTRMEQSGNALFPRKGWNILAGLLGHNAPEAVRLLEMSA